ncbi:glycosyltransferase family 2 protein [Sphingomonas sp. R647]|uniref:glycosyltransferase family 2 protein n=1 Tax=Sphingomonas sp. R647 TaxID=2875233 RepID=UPI001CD608AA|nr:glycosyltransferase family 2 protein [Sphingomonas sp. R647]
MTDRDTDSLVSVIVPTYNVQDYILSTITSVLSQTYKNVEVLCIDDCSSDATVAIIKSIDDCRVKLSTSDANQGAGRSRSRGLELARGRYIAFLDSDDLWYPDKIAQQIAALQSSGAAAAYSYYDIMDESGVVYDCENDLPELVTYRSLLAHCYIRTSSFIYDVEKVGADIRFVNARKRQDYLFFLEVLRRVGQAILVPTVTCSYRIHPGSVSSNKLRNIPYQWSVYRRYENLSLARSLYQIAHWFVRSGNIVLRRKVRLFISQRRGS